jgi:hypothetical protein
MTILNDMLHTKFHWDIFSIQVDHHTTHALSAPARFLIPPDLSPCSLWWQFYAEYGPETRRLSRDRNHVFGIGKEVKTTFHSYRISIDPPTEG